MTSIFDDPRFNASLFFPSKLPLRPVAGARDLWVEVDGARLHLRAHDAPGAAVTLLLFHGNGETVPDYDQAARAFADVGAALAVVDYRGYGASTGAPTLRACLADALPALDALLAAAPGPVVVMGRSLGGGCAAELAKTPRPRVVGYVFESAPGDVLGILRRRGVHLDALPEDDAAAFSPLPKLARCETPALVLHGACDTLIPLSEGEASFAALASAQKSLAVVPEAGHNDLSFRPEYWTALANFLASVSP
ncbi:MAG: alpha/beta fold hydrolase [Polyangiales bacterium]